MILLKQIDPAKIKSFAARMAGKARKMNERATSSLLEPVARPPTLADLNLDKRRAARDVTSSSYPAETPHTWPGVYPSIPSGLLPRKVSGPAPLRSICTSGSPL
jgi:hypothetical protein